MDNKKPVPHNENAFQMCVYEENFESHEQHIVRVCLPSSKFVKKIKKTMIVEIR